MTSFKRKSSVVHEQFGDETVIVNLDTGCYFSVQGAGDAIWTRIVEGVGRDDIAVRLGTEYDEDPTVIGAQTLAFLQNLIEEKLIEPSETPGAFHQVSANSEIVKKAWAPPMLQKYTDMEEMLQLDPIHEVDEMGWPQAKKADA